MSGDNKDLGMEKLITGALDKKVSRRTFMEGASAMGLTVAAAGSLWSSRVEAATPQKGGTFRVGMHDGNTTDQWDPGTTESVYMIQMNHAVRSYLTLITNENTLGGDIAESWSGSDDASEWTFNLQKDVTFHDGAPFTAKDAVASLNYHRGDDTKSAAKALLSDIVDIQAPDDHTLVIKASSGNADLPYLMSDYHLVMMKADAEGNVDPRSANGTGPYKVIHHEPGVASQLERHDGFFRDSYFDAIDVVVVNDPTSRQTALKTDEVDAVSSAELKTVHLLGRDPNITIDEVASGAHVTVPMFCDVAPFDNPDVRTALKLSIDREECIQKIKKGHASIGNDFPIGPSVPFWADIEQRQYDPDQAKSLLKKAGMEGLTVDLSSSDAAFAGAVDFAVLYAEQARKAGININVVREPNDGYWSNVWLKKPFCVVQWGARPTPDVMYSLAYKDDAAWNESHWKNKQFNELLLQAKAELDPAKRQEMYTKMHELCRDDGGTIVPFFINRVGARRSRVQHLENIAGNWELDGARAYERWWFA